MTRVFLADDHHLVRQALKQLLTMAGACEVVGEASSGVQLLAADPWDGVDVLVLDMAMPGFDGVEVIKRVKRLRPDLPILVLSMYHDGQVAIGALRAGAGGYLTKGANLATLTAALDNVAAGGRFIDPLLVDEVLREVEKPAAAPLYLQLSERENEVLRRITTGQPLSQIADELVLSAKTVSSYKSRLMRKLKVTNNAELLRYALEHKLHQ